MEDTKYDGVLLDVLSSCGRPERFLDIVFGFLYRRTDFYRIIDSTQATKGFPPGYANKVAYQAFEKYQKRATSDTAKKDALELVAKPAPPVSAGIREEMVDIGGEQMTLQRCEDEIVVQADGVRSKKGMANFVAGNAPHDSSDSFNGAARDNYSWTQSHDDIDVRVKITKDHRKFAVSCPEGMKLKVTAYEKDVPVTLVEGDLSHKIKESEMVWTSSPGEFIHISLEKIGSKWWDSLLTNEVKISLNELEVTKPFDELDSEEQMKIRQLQQEHLDKLKGTRETKKQNIEEMLKKAWNAEGSPFKGTPYDPSMVNMNNGTTDLNNSI
ncbi:nudC domain-containing protein 3-like [Varroa jacobsoni]|uniref:nudC domain-containing protein 3-like n=1 Tax=Varroa jacobsoni TaxID=62625 RepID=UPI000BF71E16|nr:nudC domain-containing protein 3-like [Varroa jacobsoni]